MTSIARTVNITDPVFGVIDCLILPDGRYAIAFTQVCAMFELDVKNATRTFKSLLGDEAVFEKTRSDIHFKDVNILDLPTLSRVMLELVLKGNHTAIAYARASVIEVIRTRIDEHVGKELDKAQRDADFAANYRAARKVSIKTRVDYCSVLDVYIKHNKHNFTTEQLAFLKRDLTEKLNKGYIGKLSREMKKYYGTKSSPRDFMPVETLKAIESIENFLATQIIATNYEVSPFELLEDSLKHIQPDESRLG
jgi:hypothetical protein